MLLEDLLVPGGGRTRYGADPESLLTQPLLVRECTICMDAARDTVLKPCDHAVACAGCSAGLQHCPLCRAAVEYPRPPP